VLDSTPSSIQSRPDSRLRIAPWLARLSASVLAGAVIAFLAWPVLFTSSWLGGDWGLHLWYLWREGLAFRANHEPSLFLDYGGGVFYPLYAFYGGTIYALGGLLGVLLGSPATAYTLTYALCFAAAYGGWYWLGRGAGLGLWLAQVPGLVFITSSYYLTDLYARGDWTEFVAVSTIPLLVASGLDVLLAERLSLRSASLLAASALVFYGAHNISMLWGTSVMAALSLAVVVAIPQARRRVTRRGALRVALVAGPAVLLDSWYLLPAIAYGRRTTIAATYGYAHVLRATRFMVAARHLFTFSRASVSPVSPDFVVALPLLALAWAAAGVVVCARRGRRDPWSRALLVFALAALLIGLIMTHVGLELALPAPYAVIQFEYRLETYVLLCLCAAILAILVVMTRGRPPWWRLWRWSLVPVLAASAIGAIEQVDAYPHNSNRARVLASDSLPSGGGPEPNRDNARASQTDYDDTSLPLLDVPSAPLVEFPATAVHGDSLTARIDAPAGSLVRSNLAAAPYLVTVSGASIVGRDARGFMVLRMGAGATAAGAQITIKRANSVPVAAGRLLSLLALIYLALAPLVLGLLRVRARRRGSPPLGARGSRAATSS
jgi:hypothetical protein